MLPAPPDAIAEVLGGELISTSDAHPSWERFREVLFPGERINLNPGTLGTPSTWVRQAMEGFFEGELQAYPLGQYSRGREDLTRVRALAQEIFAPQDPPPAITTGTTESLNTLALSLLVARTHPKPMKVLSTHHEHHGGLGIFEHHPGFEVLYARRDELTNPGAFEARVAKEEPDILFLSQISWTDAVALPLPSLIGAARCASQDVFIIIDSAQALGLIPPPVSLADAVVASCHKWLFGPQGTGILWVGERLREHIGGTHLNGHPLDPGDPMGAFEVSGGQDFSRYRGIGAALGLYQAVGGTQVRARSRGLARVLIDALMAGFEERGIEALRLRSSAEGSPGMFTLHFGNIDPYPLYVHLNELGIHLKCVKQDLGDGTHMNALRFGIPYYESPTRLRGSAKAIFDYLDRGGARG